MRKKLVFILGFLLWSGTALAGSLVDHEHNKFDASDNVKVNLQTALPAGTNNIGDVDVLTLPALPAGANTVGAVKDAGPNYTTIQKFGDVGIVTDSIIWDPAVGKKVVITDIVISTNAANAVTLKEGINSILKGYLAANGGMAPGGLRTPLKGALDANITITTTAGNTAIELSGYEE